MRPGIIATSIAAAALMGSAAYAQNATPAEVENAFGQAAPVMREDKGAMISTYATELTRWSSAHPVPQGDVVPANRIALAKPATRVVGSVSSPAWAQGKPMGEDISAVLATRSSR
jgi:hypothetical protein